MIGNLYEAKWQLEHELSSHGPWDFCISQIPGNVTTWPFADEFPKEDMNALYKTAEERAKSRKPWESDMPGNAISPEPCFERK